MKRSTQEKIMLVITAVVLGVTALFLVERQRRDGGENRLASSPHGQQERSAESKEEKTAKQPLVVLEPDPFDAAEENRTATVAIEISIDNQQWKTAPAVAPVKGQKITLRVSGPAEGIRWYQIYPETAKIYSNANLPWEQNPYQWKGLDKIQYHRIELIQFRDQSLIQPFEGKVPAPPQELADKLKYHNAAAGTFFFQVQILKNGKIYRSVGIEDSDNRGLSPKVLRISVRESDTYLGYLTSFFNVPGVFGSITYQSVNYIGVDCADVLMAAYGKFRSREMEKNYNVAMLVTELPKVAQFEISQGRPDKKIIWDSDIRPGDLIAVKYPGQKQYQHIGAMYRDNNQNSILDPEDLVIHAGPEPLHESPLSSGNFDGYVVILRPE